ncbi:hypothetical protein BH23GEM3_BH23GEM3_18580 [soil metagenome]
MTRFYTAGAAVRAILVLAGLSLIGACAPGVLPPAPAPAPAADPEPAPEREPAAGLPAIPRVEGPLQIRVVHPTPATPRPNVRSTFVYGSVGTGAAMLTINGTAVDVHPNGAFLAFLPVPADGRWELTAEAGGRTASTVASYRIPTPDAAVRPVETITFPRPLTGVVTGGADTLATGSDAAIGRPTPTGAYRWFLPRGSRLTLTARRGELVSAQLAGGTEAWFPANAVTLGEPAPGAAQPRPAEVNVAPAAEWVDLRVAAGGAPFLIDAREDRLTLTVYGATAPRQAISTPAGELVGPVRARDEPGVGMRVEAALARQLWGYKAFYEQDGTLVLRLRRPPSVDTRRPLQGLRVVIDPGHPPAGATGPTGLTEAEANLAIALPIAEMLRREGAAVTLTRTHNVSVSLVERVNLAAAVDAHLLISVHNNAFGEGVNPIQRHGTSTYYFHPHAAGLARELQRELQTTTLIPDLGALTGNLAMVRPTWMPAVLTESLFMAIPEQEAALRNPDFLNRLATAHLRGIEAFVRASAAQ